MNFSHRDRVLSTLDAAISAVYDEAGQLTSVDKFKLETQIEIAKKAVYDEYALKAALEDFKENPDNEHN